MGVRKRAGQPELQPAAATETLILGLEGEYESANIYAKPTHRPTRGIEYGNPPRRGCEGEERTRAKTK